MSNRREPAGSARDEPNDSAVATREELLSAALDYARRGIPVFPCHTVDAQGHCSCRDPACKNAGKHPRTGDGFKSATTDEATIREWWKSRTSNIAAVPGPKFAVLDVDPRKEDEAKNVAALGDLPGTLTMRTGAYEVDGEPVRGEHRWFEVPDGTVVPKVVGGVELKSLGGYVMMPPSRHWSGVRYEIAEGSFETVARAPSVLVDGAPTPGPELLAAPDPGRLTGLRLGRRATQALDNGFLPEPDADYKTHRAVAVGIARNMREAGFPEVVVNALMVPLMLDPMSAMDAEPWTEKDARRIVRSVFQGPAPDQAAYLKENTSRLKLTSLAETFVIADEPTDWVIPGLLAAGEKALIAGPPKAMKTWLTLHLVRCVAVGGDVLGEPEWRVPGAQSVVYVQEEGSKSRWAQRLKSVFEDPSAPFAHVHRGGFSLIDSGKVDWLIAQAIAVKARVIVIDPWQRVTPGVKENDAADTGPAWDAVHRIARETGAAVIVLHHANKGKGSPGMDMIRGSSRMAGEVDLMLVMKKKEDAKGAIEKNLLEIFLDGRDLVRDDDGGNLEVHYDGVRPHLMRSAGFKVTIAPEKRSIKTALLEAFVGCKSPVSTTDLHAGVNHVLGQVKTKQAVNKALHALSDEGQVQKMPCAPGDSQFWLWLGEGGAND